MSYRIVVQRTDVYEVEKIKRKFMKFASFRVTRKDKVACELCEKPFKDEDDTNLAFVKNMRNHLICDVCATDALKNGVPEIDW